jgi:MFS family permease
MASSLSLLGTECAATAGPLLALFLTRSPAFAAMIVAAQTAPTIILPFVAGPIVDRFDRRRVLIYCQVARLVLGSVLFAVLLAGGAPRPLVLAWAFFDGLLSMIFATCETALVPQLVSDPKTQPRALAANEARGHIALLGGRPLGGVLFGVGAAFPFLVEVLTSLASLALIAKIKTPPPLPSPPDRIGTTARNRWLDLTTGFRILARDSVLRTAVLIFTSTNFLFRTVIFLLVLKAGDDGLSPLEVGFLLAAPSIGGLIALICIRRTHVEDRNPFTAFFVSLLGWLLAVIVIVFFDSHVAWGLAWGLVGAIGVHLNVMLSSYQARKIEPNVFGRVVSASHFTTSGVIYPLGSAGGAYALSAWGPDRTGLTLTCCMGALTLLAIVPVVFARDRSGAQPAQAPQREGVPRQAGEGVAEERGGLGVSPLPQTEPGLSREQVDDGLLVTEPVRQRERPAVRFEGGFWIVEGVLDVAAEDLRVHDEAVGVGSADGLVGLEERVAELVLEERRLGRVQEGRSRWFGRKGQRVGGAPDRAEKMPAQQDMAAVLSRSYEVCVLEPVQHGRRQGFHPVVRERGTEPVGDVVAPFTMRGENLVQD